MAIVAVEELLLPQHLDLNTVKSKTFHARVGIIVRGCRSIIPRSVVPIVNTCAQKMTGLSRRIWVIAQIKRQISLIRRYVFISYTCY